MVDPNFLVDAARDLALLVVGGFLTLAGGYLSDRRRDAREKESRARTEEQRSFELGKEVVGELLMRYRELWTQFATQKMQLRSPEGLVAKGLDFTQMEYLTELIPNRDLRRASAATLRLAQNPKQFAERPGFLEYVVPRGPKGALPLQVIQILSIETVRNMLAAYLREERPETSSNELLEHVERHADDLGLSVRTLFLDSDAATPRLK
jgi:hypothetical protein